MLKNTKHSYGSIAIALHWIMALAIIGLFALGLTMMGLDYYDPLYRTLPSIHKSVGIILFALLLFRLIWRWKNMAPKHVGSRFEQLLAAWLHRGFYILLLTIMASGYLISTADGRAIEVFDWFSIPAVISSIENQEDIAGEVHQILAWLTISLAALHVLAALKHHFIDKDATLKRMTNPNYSGE